MFYHKFEAISSWYGYDYQGVLAIYYTIKKINELIDMVIEEKKQIQIENVKEIINGYSIELEYMEDFAIKFKNKYQSFHQVKSGEGKIKDEDIRDLYLKLLEYDDKSQSEITGYFHVNEKNKIMIAKESLKKQIKTYFKTLNNEINELKNNDKIDFRSQKKGSAIQILADYMAEKKLDKYKKQERIVCIEELIKKLNEINDKYFNEDEKYKIIFEKLLEYEQTFNSINEIEVEIFKQLKFFHEKIVDEEYKINKEYLEKEKCKIGVLINDHIDKRKEGNSNKEILFEEFFKILVEDLNGWGCSNEYHEYKFKEKLHSYYYQYKLESEDVERCSKCVKECYLKEQLETIKELKREEFKRFLNNISIVKRTDCFDFPSEADIKQTIFRYMCENHKIGHMEKYSIGVLKDNNEYWIITNLDDEEIPFIKKLYKDGNDNKNILRDADILITKYISINDIGMYNKYYNIDRDDMEEVIRVDLDKKYNDINNYTKNRLLSVKKWIEVKEELE